MPLRPPPTQGKMTPASARPVNSGLGKELPPAPLGYGKGIWKNTSSIKCLKMGFTIQIRVLKNYSIKVVLLERRFDVSNKRCRETVKGG